LAGNREHNHEREHEHKTQAANKQGTHLEQTAGVDVADRGVCGVHHHLDSLANEGAGSVAGETERDAPH
jgi:hypothetical protein